MYPKKNILQKIKFFFFILKNNFDYIFVLDGKDRSLISIFASGMDDKMSFLISFTGKGISNYCTISNSYKYFFINSFYFCPRIAKIT